MSSAVRLLLKHHNSVSWVSPLTSSVVSWFLWHHNVVS